MKFFLQKSFLLLAYPFILAISGFAQEIRYSEEQVIWFRPISMGEDKKHFPLVGFDGKYTIQNIGVSSLLERHRVKDISLAFPDYKKLKIKSDRGLENVYQISCECDVNILRDSLDFLFHRFYSSIETSPIYEPLYVPNDFTLLDTWQGPNWQLSLIEVQGAWDITQGSFSVPIAIVEVPTIGGNVNNYDFSHGDLTANIIYSNDATPTGDGHGTFVAGCASAVTDNNYGIASIGFNTPLMLYRGINVNNWIDAAIRGARVINCSYISCSYNGTVNDLIKDLTENGVVFVAGAGNGLWPVGHAYYGTNRGSCGAFGNGYAYPASYDNVISVSSVGEDNAHWDYKDWGGVGSRHTHNDKVDICAPGYQVLSVVPGGSWGRSSGTSFSSPITAGLVALILSVNECLQFNDVEYILKSTAEPIADAASYPGVLGAGRINALAAVQMAQSYGSVSPITSNTTWNTDRFVSGNVVVKPGNTLTVTSKVSLSEGSMIIVEPGARLVVNGGTLTSSCTWQGIEVWGNSSVAQTVGTGGYYPQGYVSLSNGAVIENSANGISTWKFGDYTKTGGLIEAQNTTFRNNGRAVGFITYGFQDKSRFTNCTFLVDAPLNNNNMVTAWGIRGMQFLGCTFEFDNSAGFSVPVRPKGIYTENAGFTVTPRCVSGPLLTCVPPNLRPNVFKNLEYGIHATNGTAYTFKVDSARFEGCRVGVGSSVVNNFEAVRTHHTLNTPSPAPYQIGIENDGGTGFKIENNTVYSTGTNWNVGIMSHATGPDFNEIYRNNFEGLLAANFSEGNNWVAGWPSGLLGLKYVCNTYQDNAVDIYSASNSTVGLLQANLTASLPAGNRFSLGTAGHFYQYGTNAVTYSHHQQVGSSSVVKPVNYTTGVVTLNDMGMPYTSAHCPSRLSWGIGSISFGESYGEYAEEFSVLEKEYKSLVDGGNTEELVLRLQTAGINDAEKLFTDLRKLSPFVSTEVLYAVAKRTDLFTPALLGEFLTGNPHCARDNSFMQFLEENGIALHEHTLRTLEEKAGTMTARDKMELELAGLFSRMSRIADEVIRYHLHADSTDSAADSAKEWISRKEGVSAKVALASREAKTGDYGKAIGILRELLSGESGLPEDYVAGIAAREKLYNLLLGYENAGQPYWLLDSSWQEELDAFARGGETVGHEEAKNIMAFFYGRTYPAKQLSLDGTPHTKEGKPSVYIRPASTGGLVKVYPNPAEGFAVFEYDIPESLYAEPIVLSVYTVGGQPVKQTNLSGKQGTYVLDVSTYTAGQYLYAVTTAGKILASGTLVVK